MKNIIVLFIFLCFVNSSFSQSIYDDFKYIPFYSPFESDNYQNKGIKLIEEGVINGTTFEHFSFSRDSFDRKGRRVIEISNQWLGFRHSKFIRQEYDEENQIVKKNDRVITSQMGNDILNELFRFFGMSDKEKSDFGNTSYAIYNYANYPPKWEIITERNRKKRHTIYFYKKENYLSEIITYSNDTLFSKEIFNYTKEGLFAGTTETEGSKTKEYSYEYQIFGDSLVIRKSFYNGKLEETEEFRFDENQKMISTILIDPKLGFREEVRKKWSENGELLEKVKRDKFDQTITKYLIVKGKSLELEEKIVSLDGQRTKKVKSQVYLFNDRNDWIEKKIYKEDFSKGEEKELVKIYYRNLEYYE